MTKFTAEKTNDGRWDLYRTIRVNGEVEERYVATVEAENAEAAIAQGGAASAFPIGKIARLGVYKPARSE